MDKLCIPRRLGAANSSYCSKLGINPPSIVRGIQSPSLGLVELRHRLKQQEKFNLEGKRALLFLALSYLLVRLAVVATVALQTLVIKSKSSLSMVSACVW